MPTYHIIQENCKSDLGEKLSVIYNAHRTFSEATLAYGGSCVLRVGNCEGSLILVDLTRKDINKLHIGELTVKRPHVESLESHGKEGPRVDLLNFDIDYSLQFLEELIRWRNPAYRAAVIARYASVKQWYCIPHRLNQLQISPQGLEQKIQELDVHIGILRKNPNRRKVSMNAAVLEYQSAQLVSLVGLQAGLFEEQRGVLIAQRTLSKTASKVIVAPDLVDLADSIRTRLVDVLDYVTPFIDLKRACDYWQETDSWKDL